MFLMCIENISCAFIKRAYALPVTSLLLRKLFTLKRKEKKTGGGVENFSMASFYISQVCVCKRIFLSHKSFLKSESSVE